MWSCKQCRNPALAVEWQPTAMEISDRYFECGHCGAQTVARYAYCQYVVGSAGTNSIVVICVGCGRPNWIHLGADGVRTQVPQPAPGRLLGDRVPHEVLATYNEARRAHAVRAFTAVATMCRKLLMNVAVAHGADEGKQFAWYVQWLADHHHTPPKSAKWVKAIKDQGNVANHEVRLFEEGEAAQLLEATYALLFFNYEMADEE